MYGNLIIEMKKAKISQTDIAELLGISKNSMCMKLKGKFSFRADEMFLIKNKVFPECSLEYLFEKK